MAFQAGNLTLWSSTYASSNPNIPQWWAYSSSTDDMAVVSAADYFNGNLGLLVDGSYLRVNDLIYCSCTDGVIQLQVATITPNVTTVAPNADIAPGSITTAMLGANIVTAAKIANGAITTTQINANAGILGSQLAANTIASGELNTNLIQYAIVPMTLAQFQGMYAAPYAILAAPAAGSVINVLGWYVSMTYGSAQLTTGGAVALQFGNTVHGAGPLATATIPAASFTGITANSQVGSNGSMGVGANSATGIYISNATAPFAVGTGATFNVVVSYMIGTL